MPWLVCSCVPPATACTLYHGNGSGERVSGSQAHESAQPHSGALVARYELIVIDELGYVPLAEIGAEPLFQVIADRAEKAAVIVTTNLPFSEWPQVFPSPRLCKAMVDRLTDRAHILETGTESFRFRRTIASRQKNAGRGHGVDVVEERSSASP